MNLRSEAESKIYDIISDYEQKIGFPVQDIIVLKQESSKPSMANINGIEGYKKPVKILGVKLVAIR